MKSIKMQHKSSLSGAAAEATFVNLVVTEDLKAFSAIVIEKSDDGKFMIQVAAQILPATLGALVIQPVVGDVVLVVRLPAQSSVVIAALLVPNPTVSFADRPLRLESGQSITLASGSAMLTLTADGLARLVANRIEQDARDAVDIDAAEIRMN